MRIVILGAGQVGSSVAENLVSEANDITVVDIDAGRLRKLQDRLDLRTGIARTLPKGEVRLTWTGAWPRPRPETPQSRSGLVLGASVYF